MGLYVVKNLHHNKGISEWREIIWKGESLFSLDHTGNSALEPANFVVRDAFFDEGLTCMSLPPENYREDGHPCKHTYK